MRIIKLGKGEFKTLEDVKDYFGRKLYERKPEGKFRLPRTKIGADGLEIGEPILFLIKQLYALLQEQNLEE